MGHEKNYMIFLFQINNNGKVIVRKVYLLNDDNIYEVISIIIMF